MRRFKGAFCAPCARQIIAIFVMCMGVSVVGYVTSSISNIMAIKNAQQTNIAAKKQLVGLGRDGTGWDGMARLMHGGGVWRATLVRGGCSGCGLKLCVDGPCHQAWPWPMPMIGSISFQCRACLTRPAGPQVMDVLRGRTIPGELSRRVYNYVDYVSSES